LELLKLNIEILLKLGRVDEAQIQIKTKDENTYKESRIKLAEIYLTVLMDRRLYTWCYIEILEHVINFIRIICNL